MAERSDVAAEPTNERELYISRAFDVPARILFLACSKPEHMREWFGPKGYPLTLCEMDFRVGGKWRFAMAECPGGPLMTPFGGEYLVIEAPTKLSYSSAEERPGAETMVVTITFEERDGRTTMVIHTLFASVAMKNAQLARGYQQGVASGLDQLGELSLRLEGPR